MDQQGFLRFPPSKPSILSIVISSRNRIQVINVTKRLFQQLTFIVQTYRIETEAISLSEKIDKKLYKRYCEETKRERTLAVDEIGAEELSLLEGEKLLGSELSVLFCNSFILGFIVTVHFVQLLFEIDSFLFAFFLWNATLRHIKIHRYRRLSHNLEGFKGISSIQ